MTDSSSILNSKRKDLRTLIDHVMQLKVDGQNETLMNCVLSRLLAELRRVEVEVLYQHILSCPGLSSQSSPALHNIAIPALQEAMDLISVKERNMTASCLSSSALAASILGLDDTESAADLSLDSSFSSDLDVLDKNGNGYANGNGNTNNGCQNNALSPPQQQKQQLHTKKRSLPKKGGALQFVFRNLFLDIPFAISVFILCSCLCAKHMYFTFWEPVLQSTQWSKQRMDSEYTNYKRVCDANDISTTSVDDIIIDPETMTAQDAMEITNRHGMSIFPNVVTREAAAEMRKWVLERNANLSEKDEIPLISQENRWSFPIGIDEDPSVPPVIRQIATNVMLQNTMDLLMGDNPAMVELTAITSAYGAGDQHWHADNDFTGSQMHYARSFVPMYSIFVPLQDTSAKMGATSACPGTHLCGSEDNLYQMCDRLDFRVGDSRGRLAESEEDHIWKSGDAFLFNLNLYHRGPGHTDPIGEERVMLIMTVSNRPNGPHFDRRQMSLGTSYSLKWDMFSMTMKDLAIVDETMMGFPWKFLRTLGIWKPKGTHHSHDVKWGWDYLTVGCSRIMNDQMGFRHEDLEKFVTNMKSLGPITSYLFGYLPSSGDYDEITMTIENGWREYFRETLKKFLTVAATLYSVSCFYFLLTSLLATGIKSTFNRFLKINLVIGLSFSFGFYYVSKTPWGSDIINNKANESPFPDRVDTSDITIVPTKYDVLFSGRLHSPFLAGMNVIHDQQPGNRKFNELVSTYSGAFVNSEKVASKIQQMILKKIMNEITDFGGQVVKNNANGDWVVTSQNDAETLILNTLVSQSNPIKAALYQEIKFLRSECNFGRMRETVLMKTHALQHLDALEKLFIDIMLDEKKPLRSFNVKHRLFVPSLVKRRQTMSSSEKIDRKNDGIYQPKKGEIVEYLFGEGWFAGTVVSVSGRGKKIRLAIKFNDGEYSSNLVVSKVRPFKAYTPGETILVENEVVTYLGVTATGSALYRDDSSEVNTVDANFISRPY